MTLAAVVMTLSGVPRLSQIRWCLLPVFRRSTGDGPVPGPPFFRADVGAVHARPRPVEIAGRVQLGEQDPVQPVKDPCLLPPVRPPPAGLSRAEPQLQRQQLPGYVVVEDDQDAPQAESVPHRPRSRRPIRPRRQQRLDQRPQLIVHDPRSSTHTSRTAESSHRPHPTSPHQQVPDTSSRPNTAVLGCFQSSTGGFGGRDECDCDSWWAWWVAVVGVFEVPVRHLAFDDAGVGAWSARGQESFQQFTAGVGEGPCRP